MRVCATGIHLAALRPVAGESPTIDIGVAPDSVVRDATALRDVAEQLHQRLQLRVRKRVAPVSIVDELDGHGAAVDARGVVGQLIFGDAGAQGAVTIDHVVNAQRGMRFDDSDVVPEVAGIYPDRLACPGIASRAAGRMDHHHVDALRASRAAAARLGHAGRNAERNEKAPANGKYSLAAADCVRPA